MANRIVLIALFLLGLAIGISGGLEQAILGRSLYLVHEAAEHNVAPPAEARTGLDTAFTLTTVSMYLGMTVGVAALIGLGLQARRERHGDQT